MKKFNSSFTIFITFFPWVEIFVPLNFTRNRYPTLYSLWRIPYLSTHYRENDLIYLVSKTKWKPHFQIPFWGGNSVPKHFLTEDFNIILLHIFKIISNIQCRSAQLNSYEFALIRPEFALNLPEFAERIFTKSGWIRANSGRIRQIFHCTDFCIFVDFFRVFFRDFFMIL